MTTTAAETLGDRIASLRGRHNLTQRDLGILTGLDEAAIYRIEEGERHPTASSLARILLGLEAVSDDEIRRCLELASERAPPDGTRYGLWS